jgi:hypothetical protein
VRVQPRNRFIVARPTCLAFRAIEDYHTLLDGGGVLLPVSRLELFPGPRLTELRCLLSDPISADQAEALRDAVLVLLCYKIAI